MGKSSFLLAEGKALQMQPLGEKHPLASVIPPPLWSVRNPNKCSLVLNSEFGTILSQLGTLGEGLDSAHVPKDVSILLSVAWMMHVCVCMHMYVCIYMHTLCTPVSHF